MIRTATVDLDVDTIDGVRIGTAATRFLAELNAQGVIKFDELHS